jgi:serine/threonine protein kinase
MRFCAACKITYPPDVLVCPKDGQNTGERKNADLFLGRLAGSYRLVEQLGEGGMGYVYLAEHPTLPKKVAVKIVRPEHAKRQDLVERFLAEAKTISLLNNEHIVGIHDFGLIDEEIPYFVMELLEGEPLSKLLARQKRVPPSEAIEIICQLLEALSAAHAKGVIHRDLKPDNVFLLQRKGQVFVKLLDFGIAKFIDPNQAIQSHTKAGNLLGTPQYMSPEQIKGYSHEIDHRSDLYSVGILLFECLCGELPFKGQSFGDLVIEHVMTAPPLASDKNPAVSKAVALALQKVMQKRREDRYQSAEEMIQALRASLQAKEPQGTLRKPYLFILGGLAVIGLAAFLLWPPASTEKVAPQKSPTTKETSRPVEVPIVPVELTLMIDSKPSGAQLFSVVEGESKLIGETPTEMRVQPGTELSLEFVKGNMKAQKKLTATQNDSLSVKLSDPDKPKDKPKDKTKDRPKDPGNGTIPFGGH